MSRATLNYLYLKEALTGKVPTAVQSMGDDVNLLHPWGFLPTNAGMQRNSEH